MKQTFQTRHDLIDSLKKGSVCAEIGVYKGRFSKYILESNEPEMLYMIDAWTHQGKEDYPDICNKRQGVLNMYFRRVTRRYGSRDNTTIMRMMSHDAAQEFKYPIFDWVYIDGNHSYESCLEDLIDWSKLIKDGGCLLGHDYFNSGYYGVERAVKEFLENGEWKITELTMDKHPSYKLERQ
jgi:hypothetical protein